MKIQSVNLLFIYLIFIFHFIFILFHFFFLKMNIMESKWRGAILTCALITDCQTALFYACQAAGTGPSCNQMERFENIWLIPTDLIIY